MASLTDMLVDGFLFSLLLSFFVSLIQWIDPRLELHNYPIEIRDKVPPKTNHEQRRFKYLAMPMTLVVFLLLIIRLFLVYGNEASLSHIWVHTFVVFVVFALFDLIILDWLIFCTLTPKYLMIPGTEKEDYKNYRYHLRGIGPKGIVFASVGAIVITGLYWVLALLGFS